MNTQQSLQSQLVVIIEKGIPINTVRDGAELWRRFCQFPISKKIYGLEQFQFEQRKSNAKHF